MLQAAVRDHEGRKADLGLRLRLGDAGPGGTGRMSGTVRGFFSVRKASPSGLSFNCLRKWWCLDRSLRAEPVVQLGVCKSGVWIGF